MSPRTAARRVIPAGPRVNPPKPRSYEPPAMPVAQNPFVQIEKRRAAGEQRLAQATSSIARTVAGLSSTKNAKRAVRGSR
jgi:hypothetical protein